MDKLIFLCFFIAVKVSASEGVRAELRNCTDSEAVLGCHKQSGNPYSMRFVRAELSPQEIRYDKSEGSVGGSWKCHFDIGKESVRTRNSNALDP